MIPKIISICILICTIASACITTVGASGVNVGNGIVYKAPADADTFLYDGPNQNFRDFLIVSFHPGFPKKRTLIKFDISHVPSTCQVVHAKMYVRFWYAHKASYLTVQQVPYLSRPLQVHQVKKQWSETAATSVYRLYGVRWSQPYAAIGTDVSYYAEDKVTMVANRPTGYVEFDVTGAMKNWLAGQPNYGLMIWDPTETTPGREIRFFSRERPESNYKPFLNVLCKPGNTWGGTTGGGSTGGGATGGGSDPLSDNGTGGGDTFISPSE